MDDIDELFTEQLNEGLTDQINGELAGDLAASLNGHLDVPLVEAINGQLELPSANIAPPAGIVERLDELHAGGCNQSIAWSRLGALACISGDRKSISIKCLQFNHDGNWKLSEYTDPSLMDKLKGFYRGFDFVHVAWSPTGTELLMVDACGRIAVGYVFVALNRISVQKILNYDPDDNLNAVVAIKWLTQFKKAGLVAGPATKDNGRWNYQLTQPEPRGPFSATQKPGFLIVTRGGMLKLYLSGMAPTDWMEVKYELDGISSSHETISHASMCSERNVSKKDDDILLAIYTTAKRLRLYTIRIEWQATQDQFGASPSFYVQHVAQLNCCIPLGHQPLLNQSTGFADGEAELCLLTIVPRQVAKSGSNVAAPPTVLAAFSHGSLSGTMGTILSRWDLEDLEAVVDPTFGQLSTKKSSQGRLPGDRILNNLDDIYLDRLIINIELTMQDGMLALCYTTGEVDFRDRSMEPILPESKLDHASSLNRIGFAFDNNEPCLQTAIASHASVKVSVNKAHDYALSSMHLSVPHPDPDVISQVMATFVLQHAASEGTGIGTTDDLVMTMWEFEQQLTEDQRKSVENQFMKDLYQVLQITAKCADPNVDGYMKLQTLGRTSSLQSALGVRMAGDNHLKWTRPGKIAFTLQSLRIIALSLSFSVLTVQKGQELDLHRPETLEYITPQVKWFITLIDYILDQLFQINRVMGTESFDGNAVAEKIESSYASLVLVMCTITRNYLRFIIRTIRQLPRLIQSMPAAQTASLSAALRSCTISPFTFDQILEMTDGILNELYSQKLPAFRQEIEMQLLAEASISPLLEPIIHKLLSKPIEQARLKNSEAEEILAFRDWGSVRLCSDKQALRWESQTVWDGSRKVDLTGKKTRLRTCLRCTGLMEEPGAGKDRAYRGWLTNLTKTCFCGGHWILGDIPSAS